MDVITSISRQENSQITVRFKLERNPDSAASDVRDRVSRVRNKLPTEETLKAHPGLRWLGPLLRRPWRWPSPSACAAMSPASS